MIIVLAKKRVFSVEDIAEYVLNNKKVIEIFYEDDLYVGKYIDDANYDEYAAEYWNNKEKQFGPFQEFLCDVMVFEDGSKVDVPVGKYEIEILNKMV